jgi:excisionase family DNA binding protein
MKSDQTGVPKLGYSIREACVASSLGRSTLYAHIKANRLRAIRIGGRTIIPAASLNLLMAGGPSAEDA